ncbi:MAG: hypothetical protein M3297_03425 [Thermoproteota archaeon]|nr:hypothetical protein [Thermoproteota archaeon]
MSPREQKYRVALITVLGISLLSLLIIPSGGGIPHFRIATGQQEDQNNAINSTGGALNQTVNMGNRSSAFTEFTQNQKGTAALSANMTQSDFDMLRQDLNEAYQALKNNDTTSLLDELNSASGELFQVISQQFDPEHVDAMTQEFNPLQTHIDRAQEAALKDNRTGTQEELNAAESELSTIIQMLPSSME